MTKTKANQKMDLVRGIFKASNSCKTENGSVPHIIVFYEIRTKAIIAACCYNTIYHRIEWYRHGGVTNIENVISAFSEEDQKLILFNLDLFL